jgi:crossover junction endodeoxyribonuclease RusA
MTLRFVFPWPPTVNHYWRHVGSKVLVSKAGRQYRETIKKIVVASGLKITLRGGVGLEIVAYPPDKRRRDLDNILKSLLDAMQHAGVFEDDNQINQIWLRRGVPKDDDGSVSVRVEAPVMPLLI